ncbi:hypothetical protein PoB_007082900 [Plakobranchus ocellatus]|uniref:Uncharacterized protein n=1 Tax=Plakobranchus ocellatus TaxID=259542 RepID=A0AAV4DJW7_9GAST|nr:hypothetical protein PoB_007082900 [Plakobranchus ocellatus]
MLQGFSSKRKRADYGKQLSMEREIFHDFVLVDLPISRPPPTAPIPCPAPTRSVRPPVAVLGVFPSSPLPPDVFHDSSETLSSSGSSITTIPAPGQATGQPVASPSPGGPRRHGSGGGQQQQQQQYHQQADLFSMDNSNSSSGSSRTGGRGRGSPDDLLS